MDVINSCYRTARKEHICDLCMCKIEKGERYHYNFIRNGDTYEWKNHLECEFVCSEIEDIISYWDGITHDEYIEGLKDFMHRFICPNCDHFNYNIGGECDDDRDAAYECFDKAVKCLKENMFTYDRKQKQFVLIPRNEPITELKGEN